MKEVVIDHLIEQWSKCSDTKNLDLLYILLLVWACDHKGFWYDPLHNNNIKYLTLSYVLKR